MGVLNEAIYGMEFDAATLRRIGAMVNAAPVFEAYYLSAMRYCVNLVSSRAVKNAPVKEGTLRRGIRGYPLSPYLGKVGVIASVPYARRREFGFDGRTDSLGRFYPRDPKDEALRVNMHYLGRALDESRPEIGAAFRTATRLSIRSIAI